MTSDGIFLAVPTADARVVSDCMTSIIGACFECARGGIPLHVMTLSGSLINVARNEIVAAFRDSRMSHLMFVDADISFPPDAVLRLYEADRDVIAGVVPERRINWARVHAAVRAGVPLGELPHYASGHNTRGLGPTYRAGEVLPVERTATAFLMIRREVFDCIELASDDLPVVQYPVANGHTAPGFFHIGRDDHGFIIGEDHYFCDLWRRVGGEIYVHTGVHCGHTGPTVHQTRPIVEEDRTSGTDTRPDRDEGALQSAACHGEVFAG